MDSQSNPQLSPLKPLPSPERAPRFLSHDRCSSLNSGMLNTAFSAPSSQGPVRALAAKKTFLFSHPRSCATAFELFFEQQGFAVACNVFDRDYHLIERVRTIKPTGDVARDDDRFERVSERLTAASGPLLVRTAAYTLMPHLQDAKLVELLAGFDERIILVRDPAYALASHRQIMEKLGESLTLEEAGYVPQLRLALLMERKGISFKVVDATRALSKPDETFAFMELPKRACEVHWKPGMQERWSQWMDWKKEVANSSGLLPPRTEEAQAIRGAQDPLYPQCQRAYEILNRRWGCREKCL